jgi:hypothetical protein
MPCPKGFAGSPSPSPLSYSSQSHRTPTGLYLHYIHKRTWQLFPYVTKVFIRLFQSLFLLINQLLL